VGRHLRHYQILSFLAKGGMGEVYLAKDTKLGRDVALKLLPAEATRDRDRLRRFEQEARTASALNHPNIITIFEIGEVGGVHFIATEYIDGQTLREMLVKTTLKLSAAIEVAIQVATALAAAHGAGLVHRDIKPENVMVRHDGYIKVLDFGLAKLTLRSAGSISAGDDQEASQEQIKTDPGTIMGTACYMSPEQMLGSPIDGRSDIFSLGVVLYELVAGRTPFEGFTAGEVMAAVLNREPAPLASSSEEVPAELKRIVSKALAKNRDDRYRFVEELANDLKSLKLKLELEARRKHSGKTRETDAPEREGLSAEEMRRRGKTESLYATQVSPPFDNANLPERLEPVGGAVPLQSDFYIERNTDGEFQSAVARQDSIVLVKGARQVGKSSLLARGLQQAREAGAGVILTDFQSLNAASLESVEKLFLTLSGSIADQLSLSVFPDQVWHAQLSPSINFERYLRREVLATVAPPIAWGLDEVDRLFTCEFSSEVFGLFRSWHNKRALDPSGPWERLTLILAYATEVHLFITDLNQSPFNVGTRLVLEDFSFEQVAELNRRYGSPLRDKAEVTRYFHLVGGHPYLVRRGLYEMAFHGLRLAALEAKADHDEGPFGDHLRRILISLSQDPALCDIMRGLLQGHISATTESFYRLRSAGLIRGDSVREIRPRTQLYATYLRSHLL
jgi:serine/threonine protein kinase